MSGMPDREFTTWLTAVERGKELPEDLPPDDAADLALAGRLLALRTTSPPHLIARVRQVHASPSRKRHRVARPGRRQAMMGFAAAMFLIIFTLAFTPVGTWAQGMLHRFGVIFLPGAMPQWSEGLPQIIPTRSPVVFRSELEVQQVTEFPLRWPTDFPFDREQTTFLGYITYTEDGIWIESLYGDTDLRYLEIQVFWHRRPGPWPVGDAQLDPVTVAGHQGLWGEGVPASFIAGARSSLALESLDGTITKIGNTETTYPGPINILLWEEGEALYMIIDSNQQFSRAELLQTAESAYRPH